MTDAILTLNAGSSSVKFALFETAQAPELRLVCGGEIESLAEAPHFSAHDGAGRLLREWRRPGAGFDALLGDVIDFAEEHLGGDRLLAAGHRVVHGGGAHARPEFVTPALVAALEELIPLAPLHLPHNIEAIRAIARHRPGLSQFACFDTAFHQTMPDVARRFALPRRFEAAGVRRYGFHGLSYEYVARRLQATQPDIAGRRVIVAHLGSGASLCAMLAGRSVDTTMGLTALDGLVMGTRCGSLDPGVVLYLQRNFGLGPDAVEHLLYAESGLLGVSGGIGADMRVLLDSADPRAREAVDLFVYRLAREAAALVGVLGGLDALVFTAGIGEHAAPIRAAVCQRLSWAGIELDAAANAGHATVISSRASRVRVLVVPTDEDAMIAQHVLESLRAGAPCSAGQSGSTGPNPR
jgi:acetate kinase